MSRGFVLMLSSIPVLAFAGAAAPKPIDLTMSWSLSLDASGAITALAPTVQTNQELYQRLEPSIRKWQFTTGKVDGKPAPAQTTLTVHITLEPADGLYRVRVRDAATGPRYATMTPPKYPDGALVSRRGGAVMLEVDYDAAGNVTSAKPIDGGLPKAGSDIERAAALAVKHWTFTPETIAGHGLAGVVRVPLCFSAHPGGENACRWRVDGVEVALDTQSLVAMNSVVHLETDATKQEL